MEITNILVEQKNCWRIAHARRVAFLIDGEAYFKAFVSAVERAQKSILVLGWDIDSRVRLLRDGPIPQFPEHLGDFLNVVVSRRRKLHAHLLLWDFAVIYAFEREPLPLFKLGWSTHRRIHFHLDAEHPIGACHHQKVVVVDDAVAFVGGFDLTKCRWNTPEHKPHDPRRIDPSGMSYRPFHDVQMIVDGEAAFWLGELARNRWNRATGQNLRPPKVSGNDPWPPDLVPDLENVSVAIARTDAAWADENRAIR